MGRLLERAIDNISEIVGKGLLISITLILGIAARDSSWNIKITSLFALFGLVTGLSVYRDFTQIRLMLWEETGVELFKPAPNIPELTGGFEQFIQVADQGSTKLGSILREIFSQTSEQENPFGRLVDILEYGISQDYFGRTLSELERLLEIKEYIDDSNRSSLEPVELNGDMVIAQSNETGTNPVEGISFDLKAEIQVSNRGESVTFDKVVAHTTLAKISGDMYQLAAQDWDPGTEMRIEELKSSLLDRTPRLEVNKGRLDQIEWDELENAYDYLSSVHTAGVTNAD